MKDEEDTRPCTDSHSSPPGLLQKSFSAAVTFPSYFKMLHPGLTQAAQAPGSVAYPEGIFPCERALLCFTGCPQGTASWVADLLGALGPLLQGFSPKHQKQMDGALCSEFWVPVLCDPASEPLRYQESQVAPLPEVCAPALEDPISKLLVLTNPVSCLYFPSPQGDSCLLQLTLRPLRVLFFPFQSANTSLAPSLEAQMVKSLPIVWETQVQPLGWEDPLEKEMATHSSILAWKIPGTEEPCRLQSMGSQRVEPTEQLH